MPTTANTTNPSASASVQKNVTTIKQEESNDGRTVLKSLETAVHDTAIQMGCWTPSDDYLLITSILHVCDLEKIHERVKFSMPFTLQNIQDRWQCLLYHGPISKMIVTKIQQLSISQMDQLRIPLNDEEEKLVATVSSNTMPAVVDEALDQLLLKHAPKFWHNRRVDELKQSWYQLRQESRLDDQKQATRLQPTESAAEHALANKLSSLSAPLEFELLTRNDPQFADMKDLPHALVHVKNRIYCMVNDQLTFGTDLPSQEFDIVIDNATNKHLQGMIFRRSGAFYVTNNGENGFLVNQVSLNPQEVAPLGTRAIIQIFDSIMAFQALELPQ